MPKSSRSQNESVPQRIEPQKLVLVTKPPKGDWRWEIKYDGYRIMARIVGGQVTLITKNGHDWTKRFPKLAKDLQRISVDGYLDGEIVVQDETGRPSFQALEASVTAGKSDSVLYFVFDVLHLQGHDLREAPLEVRREVLEHLLEQIPLERVRFSDTFNEPPESLLASACQMNLEGLVGKKAGSAYTSSRNGDWVKLKCNGRQEFVIGGYTKTKAGFGIGALMLGYYDRAGDFRYAGRVGSGLSDRNTRELSKLLTPAPMDACPFRDKPRVADAEIVWVEPAIVCEIKFAEITPAGKIRHGVFLGTRKDMSAEDVTLEIPE